MDRNLIFSMISKKNGISFELAYESNTNTVLSGVGSTSSSEVVLSNILVKGGEIQTGDSIKVETRIRKVGTNGTCTIRLRFGTVSSTSATLMGTFTSSTQSITYLPLERFLTTDYPTENRWWVQGTNSSFETDIGKTDGNWLSITASCNITQDWYISVTGQLTSTSDIMYCPYIYLEHYNGPYI